MIKAVIYDLDDTMVDSNPLHVEAFETILKKLGHDIDEMPAEIRSRFVGMRIVDISRKMCDYFKFDVNLEAFFRERNKVFLDIVKNKLQSMPGLLYSLRLFRENGLRVAIASSGTREYINFVLEKFSIAGYFDVIVSGDDVKLGKPDPETYFVACEKLGLKPGECLVLEDSTVGVQSAKSAGCKCIAFQSPNTPVQDHSKADLVLGSLEKLSMEIIRSL
ncbi:MAG: HAD family phosphatase [Candidatus Aenigmarchaeota archaeon]|nr:HAD family phosphatase [Candidatus Aenigmarchaeota archaeon]